MPIKRAKKVIAVLAPDTFPEIESLPYRVNKTRIVQFIISLYLLIMVISLPYYPIVPYTRIAAPVIGLILVSILAAQADKIRELETALVDLLKQHPPKV